MRSTSRWLSVAFVLALVVAVPASAQEAICEWACDEQTLCSLYCTLEDWSATMTCGEFGVCETPPDPPPSCSYVPITGWSFCHIDYDSQFFWYNLEREHEALHADANGNPACPQKWIQTVVDQATCFGGTDPLDCCEGDLNLPRELCHIFMSGDFCNR